jgi:hypothetical protein
MMSDIMLTSTLTCQHQAGTRHVQRWQVPTRDVRFQCLVILVDRPLDGLIVTLVPGTLYTGKRGGGRATGDSRVAIQHTQEGKAEAQMCWTGAHLYLVGELAQQVHVPLCHLIKPPECLLW